MHDDVSGFAEHGCGVGYDGNAPWRVRRTDNFAEIASGLCGIFVDCADYLDGVFFTKQADDCRSDRANSVLNDANFLFLQSRATFFPEKIPLRESKL